MKPIISFILLFFSQAVSYQYDLSVCAIFQNESSYLKEWIDHHQKNGVQHFWLYNNNSTDDFESVLKPYIKKGLVELIDWPYSSQTIYDWNEIQCNAYKDGINRSKNVSKWCAFIDTDEFLFSPNGTKLTKILKHYKKYGGVVVNWVVYGTSHVEKILPHEHMLSKLIYRTPLNHPANLHVKTIAQPHKVANCLNPHCFLYISSKFPSVDENFQPVDGALSKHVSVNIFRINHYWFRDMDFFINCKLPRQLKWTNNTQQAINFESECNEVFDPILVNKAKK